jgi:hypothetical protein
MEMSGRLHAPAAFSLGKELLCTHWIGGWVSPRAGLDAVKKRKPFLYRESKPRLCCWYSDSRSTVLNCRIIDE